MKSYYRYIKISFRGIDGDPPYVYKDNNGCYAVRGLTSEGIIFNKETYCYFERSMRFCGPVYWDPWRDLTSTAIYENFSLNDFNFLITEGSGSYIRSKTRYWG